MAKTNTNTKKTFRELYLEEKSKPTAAARFVADAASALGVTEATIRMWLSGEQLPHPARVAEVERYFGSDIETLFPDIKTKRS